MDFANGNDRVGRRVGEKDEVKRAILWLETHLRPQSRLSIIREDVHLKTLLQG
jgi:hypothetical protein